MNKASHYSKRQRRLTHFKQQVPFYIMLIIPIAFFAIFAYWPMFGLVIAFQNYKIGQPFFSDNIRWVGFRWFQQFINYPFAGRLIKNTFLLSVYDIAVTFPMAVMLALLLNEIRNDRIKKFTTTLSFLPYFISTTVVVGMLSNFLNINDGIINQIIVDLGGQPRDFMGASPYFRTLYVFSGAWQTVGFNAIVFTAAIAGVDPTLYEAAFVDGSTRFKNIFLITMPCILPTVTVMFILKCTHDFGQLEFSTAPIVRTSRFLEYPVIGQRFFRNPYISNKEVCNGFSGGTPYPSDRGFIGTRNLGQSVS